ncbi:MAG: hypothetical protein AAGA96_09870 [Verrucomicrobiota bacterium]
MIRIPFSGTSSSHGSSASHLRSHPEELPPAEPGKVDRLEMRMHLLEDKLASHAENLKSTIEERMDQIESRFERSMKSLCGEKDMDESMEKVIEFASENLELHHLPTAAAMEALNDLRDTIGITREHLEALGTSVARMREAVGSQN